MTPLTEQGKLAFAYSVAMRMEPQYQAFYGSEGWVDLEVVKASLSAIRTNSITNLEYLLSSQDEQIINVATFGQDTVGMYVQELHDLSPNDPALLT